MITSLGVLFLVGTFPPWTAHSATKDYEPVMITVNEHFNGDIGPTMLKPDTQKLSPFPNIPIFFHQGSNFFFNPRLLVSPNHVTGNIEAVITSTKEKANNSTKRVPFTSESTTTPDQPKLTEAPDVTTENVVSVEIIETANPQTPPEHINILIEEPLEIPPPPKPIIYEDIIVDPLPPVIPDAPELPPLNLTVPIIVEERPEEVVIEPVIPSIELPEPPIIEDETIIEIPTISEIPIAPTLPPLELPIFPEHIIVEEIHKSKSCIEEVITIKDELIIPKPQKLFGLLESAVSMFEQKCKLCMKLTNSVPVGIQELPYILPDIVKTIPSGKLGKTIVLLPTISELPLAPISKLPLDVIISGKSKSAQIVFPTACAHNIITERVVPNIILSEYSPKHLKLLSVPAAFLLPNRRK